MSSTCEDLKIQALQLAAPERDELVRTLIESLDGEPDETPEEIARAWDDEIERRVADLESGKTAGIPGEQVLAELRTMIARHGKS